MWLLHVWLAGAPTWTFLLSNSRPSNTFLHFMACSVFATLMKTLPGSCMGRLSGGGGTITASTSAYLSHSAYTSS